MNVRRKQRKVVIQEHHIEYNPPWVVNVYKGEHWILVQMGRRKRVSVGFLTSLSRWIEENKQKAVDL